MWHRRASLAVIITRCVVLGCAWFGWAASLPADLYKIMIATDTYIDSYYDPDPDKSKDYNYGAHDRLRAVVNGPDDNSRTHILLAQDIPSAIWNLPVSQINAATLYLNQYGYTGTDGRPISLYPLTSSFVEGSGKGKPDVSGATWGTSDGSTPWTPGGPYDSSKFVDSVGSGLGWWTWDLKPLWGDADLAAYGALLAIRPETDVPSGGFLSGTFRSSDYSTVGVRPYVELNVVPEPATGVLLLIASALTAGGALLRRRRRLAERE
ncbi:MAG: PEP-CTERM sorting domain-containing protein [Planctomycetes bacterium]|nr:PEP-CTERM sorting domain-containing protein [Planctomycetota bacterium]